MVFVKLIFALFGIGGIALIRWSRQISDANVAANRAAADSLGLTPLQRFLSKPWIPAYSHVVTILVGVVWIAFSVVVLVAVH
jgi:hypothetical protein